jgi:hypothetical protein
MEAREYLKLATDKTEVGDLIKQNNLTEAVVKMLENYALIRVKNCSIPNVSKSFNSENQLLQFIYMHTPIAIKPKSKRAKGGLVSAFKSANAFDQVCRHLAKKLFNVC